MDEQWVVVECPRCGESLTTFTLGDSQAAVCESCEYVGIPADLRPESSGESESWADALERFLEREAADNDGTATDGTDGDGADVATDGADGG